MQEFGDPPRVLPLGAGCAAFTAMKRFLRHSVFVPWRTPSPFPVPLDQSLHTPQMEPLEPPAWTFGDACAVAVWEGWLTNSYLGF